MSVKTNIYTLRHGHTDFNAQKRYAGSIDIPLNQAGIDDCRQAAAKLAGTHFDVVITSKLKRTIETAHLITGDGITTVQTALCNERNFGVMEGHTWEEVLQFDPPILMIKVGNDLHTVNPKGGEPFEDVWQRAKRFRSYLFRNYRGQNVLVISHGVFLQMFHGLLRGISCIESLASYPANLELTRFCFSGPRLMAENVVKLKSSVPDVRF